MLLILSIYCTRFETDYSSCIVGSSENICSSSGGTQEKGKTGMKLSLPPKLMVLQVFLKLTLLMTKLRVLVLCFSYFTDNSIEFKHLKCLKTFIEKIEGRHKGK
jgi:hypothetical protein